MKLPELSAAPGALTAASSYHGIETVVVDGSGDAFCPPPDELPGISGQLPAAPTHRLHIYFGGAR